MVGKSWFAMSVNMQNLPRTVKIKHTHTTKPKLSVNILGNETNKRVCKDETRTASENFKHYSTFTVIRKM